MGCAHSVLCRTRVLFKSVHSTLASATPYPWLLWALFSGSGTPSEGMTVRVHTQGLRNSYLVWLEFKYPDMTTHAIVSPPPLVWDLAVLR